ncbi:hypothetical protein LJ657_30530 [Streptomyces sp. NR30]|uniref:Uncharacterized protein n=1 Tax=Streptomyces guryensis TaxID=2886947 RepID=A0A9Q3VVS7_9ACTN|nr:hypothetical protein [Streptomyces guryensis]
MKAGPLVDGGAWVYRPVPERRVLIVPYGCTVLTPDRPPTLSHEHKQLGVFPVGEVPGLNLPDGYKQAITAWYRRRSEPPGNKPIRTGN